MNTYTIKLEATFKAKDIDEARELFWDWIEEAENNYLIIEVEEEGGERG